MGKVLDTYNRYRELLFRGDFAARHFGKGAERQRQGCHADQAPEWQA